MVDATISKFMDTPAVTIYLRNVSHSVETQKIFNKVIEEQAIEEAEDELVEALATEINMSNEDFEPIGTNALTDIKGGIIKKMESGTESVEDVI